MYLYNSSFNPFSPLDGLLYANDDIAYVTDYSDTNNLRSALPNITLTGGTTYVLVVTSFDKNVTGPIQLRAFGTGTANVSTNQYTTDVTHVPVTDITNVPATATAGSGLTLTGTVSPANATNQSINWSVKNAGTTGAVINGDTLSATAAGTVTVTATIVNGASPSTNFTKDFTIAVGAAFVPVTNITYVPTTATAGEDLSLTGTVSPGGATNQTITWSVKDAGTTGAVINGSTLSTTAAGTVKVTATVVNGATETSNYTKDFDITVSLPYVAVTDITDLPATATAGEDLSLTGTVSPGSATNQTITWSVKDAGTTGAVINGSTLSTTAGGIAKVTATVINGLTASTNYTKDFDIAVSLPFVAVTGITDVPTTATAGEDLTLTGTVSPGSATNQTITWSVTNAGTTGASISGDTLSTTAAGTVTVAATVVNGLTATTNYTKDFDIAVAPFVPVTDITGLPTEFPAGSDIGLTGMVSPANATNQTITWSVKDAGMTEPIIDRGRLAAFVPGTVTVTATIVNGKTPSENYTKDFDITVGPHFFSVFFISGVPTAATAGVDLTLTGTVSPANATNQTITWSVADAGTTGASIDGDTLSTTAAGTVTVTATIVNGAWVNTDYTEVFSISVAPIVPVTDITDVPTAVTAGEDLTLTGTVSPGDATNQTINWSVKSAGTTGAVIDVDTLSTTSAGTVTVTATVVNGASATTNYAKDFDIAVFGPVADITGVPTTATAGEDLILSGTVSPEDATNRTITWSVKDAGTTGASIDGSTLSTNAAGTVTVTATIVNGLTASTNYTKDFEITVNAAFIPVTDIGDLPTTATAGEDLTLTGTVSPGNATNQTITWSMKNAGLTGASISGNILSTTAAGTVTVTATVVNGALATTNYTKDFDITVNAAFVPVTDITDVPTTATAGSDLTLTGTVSPGNATNRTITWSVKSAGTTGAVIDEDTLSTTSAGTVTVTATVVNGLTASTDYTKNFDITVNAAFVPVTDITDLPDTATAGSDLTLTGMVSPGNATNQTITWSVKSAGTTGAVIDEDTLSTTAAGTVKVTATVVNGASATTNYIEDFDITVNAAFVPVTDITDLPTTATAGSDLTLTGMVSPGNATNQTITWSVKSAGTTGAVIDGSKLSTTAAGTVTVTATVVNGASATTNYTKDFDITVNPAMSNDTLEEEVGDTTVVAEGMFAPDAQLIVVPIAANEPDREELEEQMGSKQIIAAFEARIEPDGAFEPPLTLTFQVGEQYNGQTVYILHKLKSGNIEQFTPTVANGAVSIIVQELSPFLLAVDAPLRITTQPHDVSAVEGQEVTFSVWATGEGPLTYQWQRGDNSKAPWEDISGATAPDYTIESVTLGNHGERYRVIVTDALENSVTSDVVTLTVTKVPASPDTGDHDQPILYAALTILFAAALMLLLLKRRA